MDDQVPAPTGDGAEPDDQPTDNQANEGAEDE
jgi:hypothetical protein